MMPVPVEDREARHAGEKECGEDQMEKLGQPASPRDIQDRLVLQYSRLTTVG